MPPPPRGLPPPRAEANLLPAPPTMPLSWLAGLNCPKAFWIIEGPNLPVIELMMVFLLLAISVANCF